MAIHSLVGFDELNLHQALAERPLDFDSWTALISTVETKYSDEIDKLSLVYDSLLFEFPLCCGYWRKYAGHKARLCSVEEVVGVYEKAVESASFSVDIWVDYCCFAILIFEDPFEVSRLFRRGLSYIGKDYLCDALWDRYIEFEFSQKQWSALSRIHIEALKCPTKKLHQYYDSFKKLVTIWEEEMGCHGDSIVKLQPETRLDEEFAATEDDEVFCIINDLLEPSTRFEALKKYSSIGERLYQRASQLDLKIDCFEKNIRRTYFHVKPLDDDQLENWHHYLDFVEMNGDFDWAVKLYERCLIPCASYSEFWMRYVDYVESKGGREIANDALERATKTFLKDLPAIHLFDAGFKEKIGDVCGARAAFLGFDLHSESSFIDHAIRRANMEKRLGNNVAASNVYKEALTVATKEMPDALPILYLHYSRLQYMVTNSVDAARDILIGGIQTVANCKLLLEELITLAVHHEGARQLNILDPIVADAIIQVSDVSRGLSYEDRLHIPELYLKFIDLCGTIHDSRRAWNRHIKLFPRPLRTNSTCMQPARASSRKEIFTVGLGTHDKALVIPKEVTRIDDMSPLIQRSADNTEDMKEAPNEDVTCKADEESCELVHKAADIDLMEGDKNNKGSDIQKEQLRVSGRDEPPSLDTRDEPPSLDILSLNEPNNEPRNLNSLTDQGCREASSSGMLEREQNVEPQPSSSLFNAQVNNSDQGYCKSPTNVSTPSMRSPQRSENQKDQEWALSPFHHGSPQRQSPRRYPEDQKHKEWSVSPPRDGTPHWPEGQHHEDRSHHSQRHHSRRSSVERQGEEQQPQSHHSRWSSVERQGEEQQPHSQRQRFSPDGRGGHSTYSDRHRQNRPMYYDNSRGQRGRRMQNASRGRGTHARRGQYAHNQRFTSASQMQPSAQPGGYPSSGQYPLQSNEQYANMQNGQTYDQMWQYYYYYQQQQLMLMQQQQMQPQQQLPDSQQQTQPQQQTQEPLQSQQQLQMQANQMQLLQFQYQQQQLQLQSQLQQQDVSEQPQQADVHLVSQAQQPQLHGDLQTQQQQLYQQMQQQQQQLYQQMQQQQQLYQQMQLHGQQQQQPQQEQSNQAAHAQQQQQQWQTYQYQQQQYLLYLQQLQQQPGGHSQAQVPQQQVLSAEKEEQNESQLQQEQQLPQTPGEQQDGGHENEGAS